MQPSGHSECVVSCIHKSDTLHGALMFDLADEIY